MQIDVPEILPSGYVREKFSMSKNGKLINKSRMEDYFDPKIANSSLAVHSDIVKITK